MRSPPGKTIGILLLSGLLVVPSALMAEMYRYENKEGKMVLGNTLPREAKEQGYEILNDQGRVIERIPPPPTEKEIAERKRRDAEERRRRQQEKERRKRDKRLLRRYSAPDDAVRALHRKLRERFSSIKLKLGNIHSIENQIEEEQERAANLERSGRDVPDSLHGKLERLRAEKTNVLAKIGKELRKAEETREAFRNQIERLEELTDKDRTMPLTVPEEEEARKRLSDLRD